MSVPAGDDGRWLDVGTLWLRIVLYSMLIFDVWKERLVQSVVFAYLPHKVLGVFSVG
jgi:hypothetical protein